MLQCLVLLSASCFRDAGLVVVWMLLLLLWLFACCCFFCLGAGGGGVFGWRCARVFGEVMFVFFCVVQHARGSRNKILVGDHYHSFFNITYLKFFFTE